jgi:hypothetical protein
MTEAPVPSEREQEAELTLWADRVAEVLDGRDLPELAILFRALARRDGVVVDEALALYSAVTLEGLIDTLADEIDDRRDAGESRAAEILEELLERALDAHDRAPLDDADWDEDLPPT